MGGSSPARTRHSTTAQSPADCSPASLSSELVPPPWVTVRPAPGPERTGSLRAMFSSLIGNGLPWNNPVPRGSTAAHDRVIAFVNRPEGARPRLGLDDHSALLTNRVSAVAGMAALLNGVTSKGPLNRAHT